MKKLTLKDIAGYETEKQEAEKIINFLKHYEEYTEEGISLPKGLLLTGVPGVGKTLLATAIANEAGVNLVVFKNNDELIVDNIRSSFEKAKKQKPSILLIDEIDEIVTTRYGEVTDLQKRTLQTLLTEIDGLADSSGVIVIATANKKDSMPFALIRSGRLEKQITMKSPNFEAREAIFDLYLSKHDSLKEMDRSLLAKKTEGLTGADINNLINEVLMDCKIKNKTPDIDDFEKYIPVIIHKDVKTENDKSTLKYIMAHEIGHFICTCALKEEVPSISVERYDDVGGFIRIEKKEQEMIKYSNFKDEIVILLGGIAGEKTFLNDMINGSSSDIKKAHDIIWDILHSGMYGFEYYYSKELEFYRSNIRASDAKLFKIENKISDILNECFAKAAEIINANKDIYNILVPELKEKGRLSSEAVTKLLKEKGFNIKLPKENCK